MEILPTDNSIFPHWSSCCAGSGSHRRRGAKPSSWAHLFREQGSVRGAAPGGLEHTKDRTGSGMPVAQMWEKHPERDNAAERPTRRIFCTEAEAGHAAIWRGRSSITASLKAAEPARLTVNSLMSLFLPENCPKQSHPMGKSIRQASETHTGRLQPFSTSYLGCNVVWSATEGLGGHPVPDVLLAHAEVCDLYVPLTIQHHVVQL